MVLRVLEEGARAVASRYRLRMRHAEFNHPRLVAVYDAMRPWSRDDDFFLSVVNETPAARVLDFGCGTGRLTLGMQRPVTRSRALIPPGHPWRRGPPGTAPAISRLRR